MCSILDSLFTVVNTQSNPNLYLSVKIIKDLNLSVKLMLPFFNINLNINTTHCLAAAAQERPGMEGFWEKLWSVSKASHIITLGAESN